MITLTTEFKEELYAQILYLSNKTKTYKSLSKDQIQDSITEAYIAIQSEMIKGKLPIDNYENYKHYLFITLKNKQIDQLKKSKYVELTSEIQNRQYTEETEYDNDLYKELELSRLSSRLNVLSFEEISFLKKYYNKKIPRNQPNTQRVYRIRKKLCYKC